ncbi:hypothetical protein [Halalkalibacter wakoensis]|uniref:hypothetical protein n=1 Tax=Halalkalibacter wakoensis TaxID=127891 RepID=UPI0012E24740|nr:hypothetical protein [Halalkalibacter wakoensis]
MLEIDEFDSITVIKNPSRNQTPKLSLDTFIKRTGRAATNAVLFQELSKETKDKTGGAFSRGATIQLISATCPSCKKRKKYLIQIDQKEVLCEGRGCKTEIPLSKARTHIITSYNKNFVKKINKLMENE